MFAALFVGTGAIGIAVAAVAVRPPHSAAACAFLPRCTSNAHHRRKVCSICWMVIQTRKHFGDVCYWPKADMGECTAHVRFWGKRTCPVAARMSAFDPKRTSLLAGLRVLDSGRHRIAGGDDPL